MEDSENIQNFTGCSVFLVFSEILWWEIKERSTFLPLATNLSSKEYELEFGISQQQSRKGRPKQLHCA